MQILCVIDLIFIAPRVLLLFITKARLLKNKCSQRIKTLSKKKWLYSRTNRNLNIKIVVF